MTGIPGGPSPAAWYSQWNAYLSPDDEPLKVRRYAANVNERDRPLDAEIGFDLTPADRARLYPRDAAARVRRLEVRENYRRYSAPCPPPDVLHARIEFGDAHDFDVSCKECGVGVTGIKRFDDAQLWAHAHEVEHPRQERGAA